MDTSAPNRSQPSPNPTTADSAAPGGTSEPAITPPSAQSDTGAPRDIPPATPPVVSDDQVRLALRRVKDPDLQLNIVDLGLIYGIRVDGTTVAVDMTLTSPGCPSGPEIIGGIEQEIRSLPGVQDVQVNLIWTPFWTPDKIEPRVRAYLGL